MRQISTKGASKRLDEAQLRKIFIQFDANGDHVLSKEEIKKAFEHLGAVIPGYRANRGISHADANGDGQVNLTDELDDLVKYAVRVGYSVK
ncbi:hypothetical protein JCGZ_04288 [Jatropha curcas]|uniref:EF-hand domain-containing protein n=1 Tax=Jatropha curcas TaxID=180498 RepID=A0A067KTR6_JATCU|nr:hypothetical protein JCGZ_04288 [Jatropha curcas]